MPTNDPPAPKGRQQTVAAASSISLVPHHLWTRHAPAAAPSGLLDGWGPHNLGLTPQALCWRPFGAAIWIWEVIGEPGCPIVLACAPGSAGVSPAFKSIGPKARPSCDGRTEWGDLIPARGDLIPTRGGLIPGRGGLAPRGTELPPRGAGSAPAGTAFPQVGTASPPRGAAFARSAPVFPRAHGIVALAEPGHEIAVSMNPHTVPQSSSVFRRRTREGPRGL